MTWNTSDIPPQGGRAAVVTGFGGRGFELQFGTDYPGHFAPTMHLMPLLPKAPAARVVNLAPDWLAVGIQLPCHAIAVADHQADRHFPSGFGPIG